MAELSAMVNNFKHVSVFSPLLASSKDLTDVYLKMAKMIAADRTSSVRNVCSRLLCQSIAIDERFLCGYRLIID